MQLIFDNIAATMVGGTVLLMLVAIHLRNQQAAAEAAGYYYMNKQSLEFTYFLKRDLQNLSKVVTVSEQDSTFSFYAQTSPTDTTKRLVEYKRTRTGQRDGMDLYQIRRYVNGSYDGGSMPTLTTWQIEARNEEGGAITNPNNAQQIIVWYEALSPIQTDIKEGTTLDRTRWRATFQPQLLLNRTL